MEINTFLPFEVRLFIVLCLFVSTTIVIISTLRKRKILPSPTIPVIPPIPNISTPPMQPKVRKRIGKILVFIVWIVCFVWFVLLVVHTPTVIRSFQDTTDQSITIQFDTPINMSALGTHIVPDDKGMWQLMRYPLLPFGRTIKWKPAESIPPGQKLMIYLSNITKPISFTYGGEYLYELTTPESPTVTESTPQEGAHGVPLSTKMVLSLSSPDTMANQWDVTIQPYIHADVKRTLNKVLTIEFLEPLQPGTTYTVSIYRSTAAIRLSDFRILRESEKQNIKTITFTTQKAQFVNDFLPEGNQVSSTTPIKITFDRPFELSKLLEHIRIDPTVQTTPTWDESSHTLELKPTSWDKNTKYTVTLTKGLQDSKTNTVLERDTEFSFTTIGIASVLSVVPNHNNTQISTSTPISITFDQEVDHGSAEQAFSISPRSDGSFSWTGNTMTFTPRSQLSYETTYTVTVHPGVKSIQGIDTQTSFTSNFSTLPAQTVLNVPLFRQEESFTCNIAATRMLLAYRGVQKTEKELKEQVGTNGSRGNGNPNLGYVSQYGTYWDPLFKLAKSYRNAVLIHDWSLPQLLQEVANGNPVMIWGQNGWSDPHEISWKLSDGTKLYAINGMHSYVIKGFRGSQSNPTHVIVNDPWRGEGTITTAEFERRAKYFRKAMVIF